MKRSNGPTITVSSHGFQPGDVIEMPDGRRWTVAQVYSDTTFTVQRRRWWHSLQRLWPFRFRGFWRRVWTR